MPDVELLETINVRGAHGRIYKIRVRSGSPPDQDVAAMKVPLVPDRGFDREMEIAEVLRQYRHPYVIRFLATGIATEETYILMDLHEEGDLEDLLRSFGPLPVREALDIVIQVAEAIHFLHGLGIYHRDIKAENIVISQTGPKVMDFGTAHVYPRRGGLRLPEGDAGVPGQEADRRRDARMLGEVLYHALSGRKLYDARLFALAQRRRVTPAASTRQDAHLAREAAVEVDKLLRRALNEAHVRAYPGVRYFLSDLRRVRGLCDRTGRPPRRPPAADHILPIQAGFLEHARQLAWEATEREPENAAPWIHLGNAHLVALQAQAAHRAYAQALRRDPGSVVARLNQSYAQALLGQWDGALHSAIAAASTAGPDLHAVVRARYVREGRHLVFDAAELYSHLPHDDPHNRLMEGYARDALGEVQRAERQYRQALALDAGFAPAAEALAFLALRRHDTDSALAEARQAARLGQERAEAWLALGSAHLARGEAEDATVALTTAVSIDPNHPYCRRVLARAWSALGEAGRAEDECRHAVLTDPCWAEARLAWGDALSALGRLGEAEAAYTLAVSHNPECIDADGRPGLSFALDALTSTA